MSSVVAAEAIQTPVTRVRTKTAFYLGLSIFMVAIVLVGFWRTYFGPLLRGNVARPAVIQIHGLIFVGWMVLLMTQVFFAWRGRIQTHRRVGRWGIAYGYLVLTMGVIAGIASPVMHFKAGEWPRDQAAGFLLITLGDMVLFGSLLTAAAVYRKKPESHKRLMLGATVALLFAAVARMQFIELFQVAFFAVWLSPLVIGMAFDWRVRGKVHGAYIVSVVVLFVGALRTQFIGSEVWLPVGRAILGLF